MCPLQARLNAMCPENHYSGAYSIPRVIPLPTGVPLGMPAIPMGMVNMAAISTNSDLRVAELHAQPLQAAVAVLLFRFPDPDSEGAV
jgi:hypothetical protein